MGSHIFGIWEIRKFRWVGILNGKIFASLLFNQCVKSFHNDLVKRLYKVDG